MVERAAMNLLHMDSFDWVSSLKSDVDWELLEGLEEVVLHVHVYLRKCSGALHPLSSPKEISSMLPTLRARNILLVRVEVCDLPNTPDQSDREDPSELELI